jgi:putative peptidoglycan lipid II flippase
VNTRLATGHESGASNLYYAFRLVHLPVGLVGVAVGTAVLAEASRKAAVRDDEGARATLAEALLLCLAFAAPAAAGLFALGVPIAEMLFQWGREMSPERAQAIGLTIRWFAPAVVFYCAVKVIVPFFYAQGRVRVPVMGTLAAVVANIACGVLLYPWLRWNGLALALGAGQLVNLALLLGVVGALYGRPPAGLLGRLGRIALATAACVAAAAATLRLLPSNPSAGARIARGLLPVLSGGAAYLAAGAVMRCPEIQPLLRAARLDKIFRGH